MAVEFEVEHIIKSKGLQPFIIVRHLTPGLSFSVAKKTFLNGVEVAPYISSPRAIDEYGRPRFDLFVFYPVRGNEIEFFKERMIVELICQEPGLPG